MERFTKNIECMKLRFNNFLKPLILILLPLSLLQAQYNATDSILIKTTFKREFNNSTISQYLNSEDSNNVRAALLSLSHSNDTTFIDSIIRLNFSKYGDMIAFTLGQLGESNRSTGFLVSELEKENNPFQTECFNAIGLTGDSLTLDALLIKIKSDSLVKNKGFPKALANFFFRGIKNEAAVPYLNKNIGSKNIVSNDLFENLFALYRIGPDSSSIEALENLLTSGNKEDIISYTLNNFRKLNYFPDDFILAKQFLLSKSWNIRTEAASAICFYEFKSIDEIDSYFTLLEDDNPNVARTLAGSIKNIRYPNSIKGSLRILIETYLNNERLTENARGELFISYCSLFPTDIEEKLDDYEDMIQQKYIYRVLKENIKDSDFNFEYLTDQISESSEAELLDLLPALLAIQNRFLNEDEYAAIVLKILNGEISSSISVICYGLKTPFIFHYQEMLQEIIIDQVFRYRNNKYYTDTIRSLTYLASRINLNFYSTVLDLINQSPLNSLQRFAAEELNEPLPPKSLPDEFDKILQNSFRYKSAMIKTNKGSFTIELKPEFTPISVGNFVALAEEGFYNDLLFHRVVPDFVIQSGDTTGTGWNGPGYEIVSEFSPNPFIEGAVGMASSGKDTEGSQWFVMHSNFPHLNGRYTNFAHVIEGMNVVNIIDENDRIIQIELVNNY